MSAETQMMFSTTHHTFLVGPWKAGPTAVKVVQADDDECVVLILRDQTEVLRFCEALMAASFSPPLRDGGVIDRLDTVLSGGALGDSVPSQD